jgi:hypothetical protein
MRHDHLAACVRTVADLHVVAGTANRVRIDMCIAILTRMYGLEWNKGAIVREVDWQRDDSNACKRLCSSNSNFLAVAASTSGHRQ